MSEANDREGVVAERPKTNDGNDREGLLKLIKELKANNDGLAARNEELKARNEELESEVRILRGDEKHGDSRLPLVIKKTTTESVDLSRVDPSLVAHVASFLGLSRELLNMALTCKAFGWRRQSSGSSLVEEVARQFLVNQLQPSDVERNALPHHGNGTIAWLPILYEVEQLRLPLKFSKLLGRGVEHSGSESIVTSSYSASSTAISNYVMKIGNDDGQ